MYVAFTEIRFKRVKSSIIPIMLFPIQREMRKGATVSSLYLLLFELFYFSGSDSAKAIKQFVAAVRVR